MRASIGIVGSVGVVVAIVVAVRLRSEGRAPPDAPSMEAARTPTPMPVDEPTRPVLRPSPDLAPSPAAASRPEGAAEPLDSSEFAEVDPVAATRERDAQVNALRASGSDQGLGRATRGVTAAFARLVAGRAAPIRSEPFECHQAGCFVTVVERTSQIAEQMTSDVLSAPDVESWSGPQMRSTPIVHGDGAVELTWFFFAPEEGGQTRQP